MGGDTRGNARAGEKTEVWETNQKDARAGEMAEQEKH